MTSALGLGGVAAAMLEKCALSTAWAQGATDYKALVCVFLNGGNDGNQTVVPLSGAAGFPAADVTGGSPASSAERSGPGLATAAPPATGPEPANTLLRISAGAANPNLGPFGLHPNLGLTFNAITGGVTIPVPSLKALYDQGKVAIVCNVGTLIQSLSKAQFQSGLSRPDQLFSHSDQIRE